MTGGSLIDQARSYRIEGIALFDVILTFFVAWIFEDTIVQKWKWFPCARSYYCAMIPIGFMFHVVFRKHTPLTMALLSADFNWQKLVFILLLLGTLLPC